MSSDQESYSDERIQEILADTQTIAMIGASANPERPSNRVMTYLQQAGFRVIPINPNISGQQLWGESVYASLADVPDQMDLVDVFRRLEAIPETVDELLSVKDSKGIRYLWLQLGIYDSNSAKRARAAGLGVVMDRCLKIEHGRLAS